ncbi:MAG: ATP-dependent metallopeptidase FtsH/Yme1/Tma family protein [Parcubacteria group bacterium]|nr:ATP-dependent metallopeptidase FtsH/Yme1/Tma family protein [Parcubacteria group bacterium]
MRIVIIWIGLLVLVIIAYQFLSSKTEQEIRDYSEVVELVEHNKVAEVEIRGSSIVGKTKEGKMFITYAPEDPEFIKLLIAKDVRVRASAESNFPWFLVIWVVVIVAVSIFFFKRAKKGITGQMDQQKQFSKSKARLLEEDREKKTFEDVAGIDEAVEEVREVVNFHKDREKYKKLNAKAPRGALLAGAPGTGKTLLAKAIAGEAGLPFYYVSGSDFVEMFVGVGASRVRDTFEEAKKKAPCIIFIDELDALGKQRGAGFGAGFNEGEQTLNQMLVEMDGMDTESGVIIIAATNRPDVLDPALIRPGRFDRQIFVPAPDIVGREKILEIHTKDTPLDETVKLFIVAKTTPGFTGAGLENICNEAALIAVRKQREAVSMDDFHDAVEKSQIGSARNGMKISEREKNIIAHHEIGHAIVATLLKEADPVKRVTIIPHGPALGITWNMPLEDVNILSLEQFLARIKVFMGGRAAEKIFLNLRTSGASNDIQQSTSIARDMVTAYGMDEKIGPVNFGEKNMNPFLGQGRIRSQETSENMQNLIEAQIQEIIKSSYKEVERIISDNRVVIEVLVKLIREKETIDGETIESALRKVGKNKPNSL